MTYPTFEQYLSIKHINLAIPSIQIVNQEELIELADIESKLLLKKYQPDYIDCLGLSILRSQIAKSLYPQNEYQNVICYNNVSILFYILSELKISFEIIDLTNDNNFDVQVRINKLEKEKKYIVLIHSSFSELSQHAKRKNVILVSNTAKMYGITGQNVAWSLIQDNVLNQHIHNALHQIGAECSYTSEIFTLIALRKHQHLLNLYQETLAKNCDYLASFFYRYRELFNWAPPHEYTMKGYITLKDHATNVDKYCTRLLSEASILLTPNTNQNRIDIYCGQKNISNTLIAWEKFINKKG